MRKSYSATLLSVGVALASLSSCSRATYSFNNSAPAYLGTTRVVATPAHPVASAASPEAPTVAPAAAAALALAHPVPKRAAHRRAHSRPAAAAEVSSALIKADRKEIKQALRQVVKQQKVASPNSVSAEGKSQLVAALLCFFLGGLGIHDFYLGYTGKGILQIFLTLLFGLGIILVLIDLVRILTGNLKPKDGDYTTKL